MAHYDNFFFSERASVTPPGRMMINFRNKWFLKLIKNYVKSQNTSILEIGPGKGYFAESAIKSGFDYMGLEVNKRMTSLFQKKGINVKNREVPPFGVGNKKFDVIFANQVFEHMSNRKAAIKFINESKKSLKKDGVIILSCPDVSIWGGDFFAADFTHNHPTSPFNTTQILEDNGFSVVYMTHYSLFFTGYLISKLISNVAHFLDRVLILDILFGKKMQKIKASTLASFVIIAKHSTKKGS